MHLVHRGDTEYRIVDGNTDKPEELAKMSTCGFRFKAVPALEEKVAEAEEEVHHHLHCFHVASPSFPSPSC